MYNSKEYMKYFSWFIKSRNKFATCRGADEHEYFKAREWIAQGGTRCYNFWDVDAEHPRTAVNYSVRKV